MKHFALLACLLSAAVSAFPAQRPANAPAAAVEDEVKDRFVPAPLDTQSIQGLLGRRMAVNLQGRLLHVDEAGLLAGFRRRPGSQAWIGEHIGKFLDAGSRTWLYSGDVKLQAMLDRMARELISTQLPDGYLGTYSESERWTNWDVWVHKYDLLGLLAYYQATGYPPALDAARKIGDLLMNTFGEGPGQRDIIRAGTHMGMAATSVLEPICLLHRYTGEMRYIEFARYIVRAIEFPEGPRILRSLNQTGSVARTANGKAYEMMSNLVGLLELYRLTGDETLLKPARAAWVDISSKRLYITGTTSAGEHFRDDYELPGEEASAVGEGCATVTWLQLNWQLLRLTGEPQYADELERTVYNQLLGAQDPHNGNLCYFTPLVGRKRPGPGINCCVSSGPRGISLIPQLAWGTREGGVAILFYVPGEASIPLAPGTTIPIKVETKYPEDGAVTIVLRTQKSVRFPLQLRVPPWATTFTATAGGKTLAGQPGQFLTIDRIWRPGDRVRISMELPVRILAGGPSYPDYVAVQRGPQVLALEAAVNPAVPYLDRTSPASLDVSGLRLTAAPERLPKTWGGTQAYSIEGFSQGKPQTLVLVPFADAQNYRVWLRKPGQIPVGQVPLTAFGTESWSRSGSVQGSICDERPDTYRTTFEGRPANEDWYAVEMDKPAEIVRVTFRHGKVFENGGWFDASASKPVVQVRRTKNGPWQTVAVLESYPTLNSAQIPALRDGEPFTVRLPQPLTVIAVRIVGKPARSFSSCAELAAYAQ